MGHPPTRHVSLRARDVTSPVDIPDRCPGGRPLGEPAKNAGYSTELCTLWSRSWVFYESQPIRLATVTAQLTPAIGPAGWYSHGMSKQHRTAPLTALDGITSAFDPTGSILRRCYKSATEQHEAASGQEQPDGVTRAWQTLGDAMHKAMGMKVTRSCQQKP